MFSILVPIYNFDCTELITELHRQASGSGKKFEILCYDDCSDESVRSVNAKLSELDHITYKQLDSNHGRSAIRNLLATEAQFEFLIFLDCDSAVTNSDFVSNYITEMKPGQVVCGGRVYSQNPPEHYSRFLRWKTGSEKEVFPAEVRQRKPYKSFMTNNFVVPKDVFLSIRMDESLTQYGHEDTLFGIELKRRKIPIGHIDNPLAHIGLETAQEFLAKTRQGLENLITLINRGAITDDVKIFRYYKGLKRTGLSKPVLKKFIKNRKEMEANLCSAKPNIKKFDQYKIGYLLWLDSQAK